MVWLPNPSPAGKASCQAAPPLARAVPAAVPSTVTTTRLSASAVPRTTGVAPVLSTCVTVGAAGAVVSMVRTVAADRSPTLPARSVACTCTRWVPSVKALATLTLQAPEASATARPATAPSTSTATVLPASAVPEKVGLALAERFPVPAATEPAATGRDGTLGLVVSTVTVSAAEGSPETP